MRLAALFVLLAGPAAAVTCETIDYEGARYTACEVDPATENLRLFHTGPDGEVFGSFAAIDASRDVEDLSFAMNAGMYHDDRAPVGHYLENGIETMRVITSEGPGNFGLLPNGILCITDQTARVYETLDYVETAPECRDATQSGPMLVVDGALHPKLLPDGTSRLIRNGVGTSANGDRAVFVISGTAVNFHSFASFFRDRLGLPDALFFDGRVSRLHDPASGRSDGGLPMGPIVGVLE
ncbi:phosphodiester glycosidase family protein [Paraglaciecola sp.]|uniref:phosphodiester glycosidase family protein n=1 Tax=Paraglaciecola sp. TaxID=1920173 RepID=UPI003EF37318